jgi:hypothetical protein
MVPSMSIRRQANELDVSRAARALFLGIGGMAANRAAAKDLGSTGLPRSVKTAPPAGKLALSLWVEYRKNEPFATQVGDVVLQGYAMGCAYGGELEKAAEVLFPNIAVVRVELRGRLKIARLHLLPASHRAEFWRDCGRIYSLGGNVELAILCLRAAHGGSFRGKEAAKLSPDFANVRDHPITALEFRRLFP